MAKSAFSGMRDATRGYASNFLRQGRYVVRIDDVESFEDSKDARHWKNTLTILAVDSGDHKVGETVHVQWKRGEYPKVFLGNIKGFMAGVMGASDDEVGEEEVEQLLKDKMFNGLVTVVTATNAKSKNKKDEQGNPTEYTRYAWTPSMTSAEILEAIGEEAVARFFPNGLPEEK